MNKIDTILKEIGEDKHTNFTTTSDLFKSDLWNFFNNEKFSDGVCIEFGTHKGQTARVLSHLFKEVITVNKTEQSFALAQQLNEGIDNIEYVAFDLYDTDVETRITDKQICMAFIDAGHAKKQVIFDIERVRRHNLAEDMYFVFDDFGMHDPVYSAINIFLENHILEYVQDIGYPMGYNFGGTPPRVLKNGAEGIICRLNQEI